MRDSIIELTPKHIKYKYPYIKIIKFAISKSILETKHMRRYNQAIMELMMVNITFWEGGGLWEGEKKVSSLIPNLTMQKQRRDRDQYIVARQTVCLWQKGRSVYGGE